MSEAERSIDPPATPREHHDQRKLHAEELAIAALGVLSLLGIAIADFSARQSFLYWMWMAPIFAAVSLYTGWARARRQGQSIGSIMLKQGIHWSVLPIAIYLVYFLQATGRLNREDAGLVALLSLALTTFLAGVHFDWRLAVLGVGLAAGALFAALVEEFFWVFLLIGVPILALIFWRARSARRKSDASPPDTPGASAS